MAFNINIGSIRQEQEDFRSYGSPALTRTQPAMGRSTPGNMSLLKPKLLASVFNNVADCLFILSVEGDVYRFVSVNRAFTEVTGLTEDNVVGKLATEVIPEASHELVLSNYRKAITSGATVSWNEISEFPAGRRVGEVSVTPNVDTESGETYLIGTVHDVTTLHEIADAQMKLAERQSAILNALPAHIAFLDQDGGIVAVNASWKNFARQNAFCGLDYGIGTNYLAVTDAASGPGAEAAAEGLRNVLAGTSKQFELEYPCDSPTEKRWFRLVITSLAAGTRSGAVVMHIDLTERKMAEDALSESEKQYRRVVDNSPLFIYVVDRNGIFTMSEGKALETTGLKPGEIVGRSAFDLYGGVRVREDSGEVINGTTVLERVFAGEQITGVSDHDGRYYDNSFIPIVEDDGTVTGMVGVSFPITERVLAEERLRKSEELFRSMIEHGSDMISLHTADGTVEYQSPSITRILGYGPAEIIGHGMIEFVHPDDRGRVEKETAAILSSPGVHPPFEVRFRNRSGSYVWLECTGTNLLENPAIGRVLFNCRDVDDRKQVESALRESENLYRETVENANDIIFTLDREGNYISVNRAGELATGYTHEEISEMSYDDIIAPEHVDLVRQLMENREGGKGEATHELELIAKDGHRIAVEVSSRLLERDGRPAAILGIARDITERRKAEERLAHVEDQLRQSQKLESVGLLAGGIAHDFNNMLTAINGYSDLILRSIDDEDPNRPKVEEIKKAGERARALTYQLLAFSRKQILRPRTININEIVTDVAKMLERLIGEDIALIAVLNERLGQIEGDPGQITQVLVNLAVNGRDAMPSGGKLTIETDNIELDEDYTDVHSTVAKGSYVLLSVHDNGSGMDAATQKRVFEPFFTTKEVGKGTGMGLATVYGIVKQSGGSIWIYSELGRGTTVKVYFPRIDKKADKVPIESPNEDIPKGHGTILLVEDEEMVRSLATQILQGCGYTVVAAADGEEAFGILEKGTAEFDLMITDVVMPRMGGRELVRRVADIRPEMPVIYISGYTDNAIVHQGILDEGSHFLQKPFSPQGLARKVRELIDGGSGSNIPH